MDKMQKGKGETREQKLGHRRGSKRRIQGMRRWYRVERKKERKKERREAARKEERKEETGQKRDRKGDKNGQDEVQGYRKEDKGGRQVKDGHSRCIKEEREGDKG